MAVRVTGILVILNSFNVEEKLQTLSNGAVFCSGLDVEETAVRVKGILVLLHNFKVEKNMRMSAKAVIVNNRLGDEFYKGGAGK